MLPNYIVYFETHFIVDQHLFIYFQIYLGNSLERVNASSQVTLHAQVTTVEEACLSISCFQSPAYSGHLAGRRLWWPTLGLTWSHIVSSALTSAEFLNVLTLHGFLLNLPHKLNCNGINLTSLRHHLMPDISTANKCKKPGWTSSPITRSLVCLFLYFLFHVRSFYFPFILSFIGIKL